MINTENRGRLFCNIAIEKTIMVRCCFYIIFFSLFSTIQKTLLPSSENSKQSCCNLIQNSCTIPIKTIFIPISSAQNLYSQYHHPSDDLFDCSITYRFQQSINNDEIARSLFQYNPLLFIGENTSSAGNRPVEALVPEYFGLASDTNIGLELSPRIRNQIIDLQLSFQGENAWIQVNLPLIKPQWQITTLPITNNTMVGSLPLENDATTYIYNIGQISPTYTATLPPCATSNSGTGYNTLPPATSTSSNGAYIVSTLDASDFEASLCSSATPPEPTGQSSIFTTADQNTSPSNMSSNIYNAGFSGDSELSVNNWILPIGSWSTEYEGFLYQAPITIAAVDSTPAYIQQASLESQGVIELSGSVNNIAEDTGQGEINTVQITQSYLPSAQTLEDALSGNYDFNQTLTRLYLNFPFDQGTTTSSWSISDIIIWIGYDVCKSAKKHIGLYLHGVVPGGTQVNADWNTYIFNPIVGNGNHYQLGCGLSAHYLFCEKKYVSYIARINGYVDHVFATDQFRVFDYDNNSPMSRYSILKALNYNGDQGDTSPEIFNDDYEFSNLDILGNLNNATIKVNNTVKSEFIAELAVQTEHHTTSIGYAFSGLSSDLVNKKTIPQYASNSKEDESQIYYGYKGNTAISNIIITNITAESASLCYAIPNSTTGNPPIMQNIFYIKSCGDVTAGGDSGAYSYGETTGGESNGTEAVGTTSEDVFILPNLIDNCTGLMDSQILNRIYGKFEYSWDSFYKPILGILGSYGFVANNYFTAAYWDVGLYLGCSF